ncbi:MAG: toxin-antitoxin system HicB family antitoxin [Opitutaceae bacterium]|nr:toxin-antitoxin system HicB family antitoxin [Opitutaceae bacterium]
MKAAAKKTETPATLARRYLKRVEWSEKEGCFVGSAPPIIGPCCHGRTEAEVMAQLATIVEEWVEVMLADGHPLPTGTAGKKYSGQFVVRVAPELHKKASLKALARGESLNQFVATALAGA